MIESPDRKVRFQDSKPKYSPISKRKSFTNQEVSNNIREVSDEMRNQVKKTKKQHLNDTVTDLLTNMQTEDQRQHRLNRDRKSILDLDIGSVTQQGFKKNRKNKKKHNLSVDMTKHQTQTEGFISDSYSSEEFQPQPTFYDRELSHLQKKKFNLDVLKNKKKQEENASLTGTPMLSENTRTLIRERLQKDKPIYLRTQEVLERKTNKIENLKRMYAEIDKVQENAPKKPLRPFSQTQVEDWVEKKYQWYQKKQDRVERMKKGRNKIETEANSVLFKPNINKTSDILAKMRISSNEDNNNKLLHDRLYDHSYLITEKQEKLMMEQVPTFSPIVNTKKPNYFPSRPSFLNNKNNKKKNHHLNKSAYGPGINQKQGTQAVSKRISPKKSKKTLTPSPQRKLRVNYPSDKKWEDIIESINTNQRKQEAYDILYKLNVRTASAWDHDKENFVHMNPKFALLLKKAAK